MNRFSTVSLLQTPAHTALTYYNTTIILSISIPYAYASPFFPSPLSTTMNQAEIDGHRAFYRFNNNGTIGIKSSLSSTLTSYSNNGYSQIHALQLQTHPPEFLHNTPNIARFKGTTFTNEKENALRNSTVLSVISHFPHFRHHQLQYKKYTRRFHTPTQLLLYRLILGSTLPSVRSSPCQSYQR